jgi:hypothetical protein
MLHYSDLSRCLDADPEKFKIFVNKCDVLNPNQQWTWGFINKTMIDQWDATIDDKFLKN